MLRVPHLAGFGHRGRSAVLLSTCMAGLCFTLFGYDQGVLGQVITLPRFLDTFPETSDPDVSGVTVSIYEIGCLIGAASQIWLGDRMGRKTSIMLGMIITIAGAVIMSASYGLPEFIIGRIVCGLGTGINTATVPTYQGEIAPPHIRGALVLVSGALISGGIMCAYWIGLAFYWTPSSAQWRGPIAIQIVFALAVMVLLFFVPESPAWLVKHGHNDEARRVLSQLQGCDKDDQSIDQSIDAIETSISEIAAFRFRDLFTHGPGQNFRRAAIAITAQAFQQLSGINLVTYYLTSVLESIGLSALMARIIAGVNGTEYFLAAIASIFFVDRLGRRFTMLTGAVVMGSCFLALTVAAHFSNQGNVQAGYAAVFFLFLFNTAFAFGWLGQTWLYPAELTSLGIRSQAASLSTCSNWIWNFVVVMITPPAFAQIREYTYLVFCVLNLGLIVPVVFFFFPETKQRSLEELDLVFAEAYLEKLNYVKHSLTRPRISGAELDAELANVVAGGKVRGETEQKEKALRPPAMRRLTTGLTRQAKPATTSAAPAVSVAPSNASTTTVVSDTPGAQKPSEKRDDE